MDTKWIENAFEKAQLKNSLPPDKRVFLEKFPALFFAFLMSYGPEAAEKVTSTMTSNEDITRFICLAFCCGMAEGKRTDSK